jgi:hypothetical protein
LFKGGPGLDSEDKRTIEDMTELRLLVLRLMPGAA